ncbi:MAG: carbohydrate-binding protein [Verrucomicrobia bacterium]|nr:carbohydrate-binding protein [Verrucomicrobiota bacterium]
MKTRQLILLAAFSLITPQLKADETKPYKGKVHAIPGLIEAEHWDEGKAGTAYHDIDEPNRGEDYREKTQVDIEKRPDASNGHGIGWTKKGEWLIYTVEVNESGMYNIEMDGKDVTGPINVPDTGSWKTLKLVTHKNVKLEKGVHLMKVVMDSEGGSKSIGDIDYFKFNKTND